MTFPAIYLDETKYCSLTVAAERSGYQYTYLSVLVSRGHIKKAPIGEAILVDIASLDAYAAKRYPYRVEALDIANTYGTVHSAHQNQYGPKCGCIDKSAVSYLLAQGLIEAVGWQNGLKLYAITDEGRKRAKKG